MASKTAQTSPQTAAEVFLRLGSISIKTLLVLGLVGLVFAVRMGVGSPEQHFFVHQDGAMLFAIPCVLVALGALSLKRFGVLDMNGWLTPKTVVLAAAAVFAISVAGVWLVFENYALSLDEFMANFDAQIFAAGHLMAKLPTEWVAYADTMQPKFVLQTKGHEFWASAYLPVNAMIRGLGEVLHIRPLVNPILAVIAMMATWGVGRQIWPQHPRRAVAAALLLATSSQFLVMAMSAYAMTAHLAFNMVWLWLVLKDRRWADVCALPIAFAACGLHQMVFHPFFAGPFILEMLIARRWARAGVFMAAYAVTGLFWLSYWAIIFKVVGATPLTAISAGPGYFVNQFLSFVTQFRIDNFGMIALNLTRFVTWQNLIMLPLCLVGGRLALRKAGPLRAMAIGMMVVPVLMTIVLPTQVHGWGYRYLHGFLGAGCLLAVHGWVSLMEGLEPEQRQLADRGFVAAALASLVIMLPLHGYAAWSFSHPLARSYRVITERPEDIVLIDTGTLAFDHGSLQRNDPFLRNHPKVLLMGMLNESQLDDLCRRGKVWVFDANNPAAAGIITWDAEWRPEALAMRDHLRQIGCAT